MNHLKKLLTRPLANVSTGLVIAALVVALLGFADATYLTVEHYQGVIPPCTTGGCEIVLTSAFSTVMGIPVALLGSIYYLLICIGLFAYLDTRKTAILRTTMFLPCLGFIGSLWFIYLQAFVIKSYCQYCLVSAGISTLLTIVTVFIMIRYHDRPTSFNENI